MNFDSVHHPENYSCKWST